jgi:hypothetical protein
VTKLPDPFQDSTWPEPAAPSAAVSAAIHQICTADLHPVKSRSIADRIVRSILLSGGLFAVLLALGWRLHPPQRAVAVALAGALVWGIAQASVIIVGLGRAPGKRAHRFIRWAVVFAVPMAFFVHLTLASDVTLSIQDFVTAPHSMRHTVVCGVHALLFGVMAMATLFTLWRRTDPFSPRLSGAVAGLAGGLVGAVALDMTCPHLEAWHLWIGHGLTLVALVLAGWYAGRRWLAP